MKRLLLSISIVLTTVFAYGQDQVILTVGDTINCKIYWVAQGQISIDYNGEKSELSLAAVDHYYWQGIKHDNEKETQEVNEVRTEKITFKLPGSSMISGGGSLLVIAGILGTLVSVLSLTGTINEKNQGMFIGLSVGGGVSMLIGGGLIMAGARKNRDIELTINYNESSEKTLKTK